MLNTFKIGHYTDLERVTGCTVIIPPKGNIASAAARGSSPGSREYALLSPKRKISEIHALVLTGGSAFGLNCAHGIMMGLSKAGIGYPTNFGLVPIVPAAVIFDKNMGDPTAFPEEQHARAALSSAAYGNKTMGNVGAGTGATVGKWNGMKYALKGGLGISEKEYGQVKVAALTVVNAVGDVLGPDGQIFAGAADAKGEFLAKNNPFSRWDNTKIGLAENTILSVIMTNAIVTKQQAHSGAEHAHHGIARRIEPSHTNYDGDICFVISSGQQSAGIDLLNSLIVNAVEDSIFAAINSADTLAGVRSLKELTK